MISGGLNGGAVALIAAIPMLLAMFASVGAVAVLVPVLAQFLVAIMTPFLFGAGIILISLIIIASVELNRLMWTNYMKYYFEGEFSAYEEACSIAGKLGAYSLFAIDVANYLTSITAAGAVEGGIGSIPDLSNKAVKHPMNDHMPVKYANQLRYISRESAENYLRDKTFFNANWTETQVREALNIGYKEALNSGVITGKYSITYLGDKVTVCLENGVFKTGYGDYVFSYDELIELLER